LVELLLRKKLFPFRGAKPTQPSQYSFLGKGS